MFFLRSTLTFTIRQYEPRTRFFLSSYFQYLKILKTKLIPIENGKKFELFLPNVREQGIHVDLCWAILSQGTFYPVEIFSVTACEMSRSTCIDLSWQSQYRTVGLSPNQNNHRKLYVKCGFPCKNKLHNFRTFSK